MRNYNNIVWLQAVQKVLSVVEWDKLFINIILRRFMFHFPGRKENHWFIKCYFLVQFCQKCALTTLCWFLISDYILFGDLDINMLLNSYITFFWLRGRRHLLQKKHFFLFNCREILKTMLSSQFEILLKRSINKAIF